MQLELTSGRDYQDTYGELIEMFPDDAVPTTAIDIIHGYDWNSHFTIHNYTQK